MVDARLVVRMLVVLSVLVVFTAGTAVGVVVALASVGATVAPTVFLPPAWGAVAAGGLGAVLLLALSWYELRDVNRLVADRLDAKPAVADPDSPAHRDLSSLVDRLAVQFDVPTPTVAVAETPVPHASVSGLTRGSAWLVVSTGLLDRLSGDEVAAVVAHELAHVVNRDVALTTLVALPVVLAQASLDGLGAQHTPEEQEIHPALTGNLFTIAGFLVAGTVWAVSKALLSVFARQRELVADQASARATGSPAALASALRRLDATAENAPTDDLREVAAVGSLSVVSPRSPSDVSTQSTSEPEYTIWTDDRPPRSVRLAESLREFGEQAFRTHPSTERRCDALEGMIRER